MNLPNSITVFRILLIPVFMVLLLGSLPLGADKARADELSALLAALVFGLAAASDSLDGYFARRRRQITVLGAFLDPLADKLLVSAALLALIELQKLSAWIAMVIIAREFAVSGLRMVAAAEAVIIPASKWGKAKTAGQMAAILAVILDPAVELAGRRISWYLVMVAVVLTIWSGIDYFVKARERLYMPERPSEEPRVPAEGADEVEERARGGG
ncbi:MAG: CDP-diacylglycerol--glycerol-3-phosphate 3-phosphatidyltransferase [Actinobacteria bacterium]|nr:CDP-diacylglycerol--glycerol-3-phosphate 3-phosphatidyltransferase [Actinomycetota bacterium]